MEEVRRGSASHVLEKASSAKPRARSIPSSLKSRSEKSGSGASSGGYEISVYESKSCESVRKHGLEERTKLTVTRQLLYKEALYTATHMLGKPSTRFPSNQEDILTYVQITFAQQVQEQIDFIQHVTGEPFPLTIVNVGIRRAENLGARDKNGLSDPYCLISVETEESVDKSLWKHVDFGSPLRPKHVKHAKDRERPMAETRFDQHYDALPRSIRTTIEHETLNPVWEQRFQCLALRPSHDILHVEVWDHDDETADAKSVQMARGPQMTRAVEEGISSAYAGKKDDFIGKAMTKISEIPVEGEEKWFHLVGKTHRGGIEAQGKLLMQVWLTHSFRHGVHYKSPAPPRILLERLWDFVLEFESRRQSVGGGLWDGEIPMAATCLLFQYGLQSGISESTQAVIRFNAYSKRNLQMHGTELRLRELETCLKKYEQLSGESRTGKISHCDQEEMVASLINSLRSPADVIRRHFTEKQEKVAEALKSFRYVLNILERIGSGRESEHVRNELKVALRIGVLEWYQLTFLDNVKGPPQESQVSAICSLTKAVRTVNEKLDEGNEMWKAMFWMEGNVDYMPIIYDEFQKMIIHDVEAVTWATLRNYDDNDDLREILLRMSPEHKALCRCLFELYVETQHFVLFQSHVLPNRPGRRHEATFAHLAEYQAWFRPVLVLWLGFAFIRAHDLISACIFHDETSGDATVLTTSSAADTVFVFQQLASFREELNWPDPSESFVVAMFLVEVMAYMAILYARIKRLKIDKEGYFDTQDRFDISERLCRALNNIQYVQEAVQSAPRHLQIDKILEELEGTVGGGSEVWQSSHSRIIRSLSTAIVETEKELVIIVSGIGDRVRPEIKRAWEECLRRLEGNVEGTEHLEPLYDYLEYNLRILHDFLFHVNFLRLVQMFWILICQELVSAVSHFPGTTTPEQRSFFGKVSSLLPPLVDYLQGNGEGLTLKQVDCPHFLFAQKYLHMFTLDSETLRMRFYFDRAMEQLELKALGKLGSLDTRATFFNGKLRVEVICARSLVALDQPSKIWEICRKLSPPTSDPRVEMELLVDPKLGIGNIRSQQTQTKAETLNPTFQETFEFPLAKDVLESPHTVLRFTLKDVDILSRNDFMGEALLPIAMLPGIASQKPLPQPMTLQLRSIEKKEKNPYLLVLKSRKWEADSQQFVSMQLKRVVNETTEVSSTH